MTPRPPLVAGIAAGAGTSTVAAMLHGLDGGVDPRVGPAVPLTRHAGRRADLLVARDDPASLRMLTDLRLDAGTVAAVVLGPGTYPPLAAGALRSVAGQAQVVALPHVAGLAGRVPAAHLPLLLGRAPHHLPVPLRELVDAVRRVATALVAGGRLGGGSGPDDRDYLDDLDDLDDEALERAAC